MFRPSRNFKVPQVSGGQWKDHQTFQRWDPASKRLVQVACCLPTPCFIPEPVASVTISNLSNTGCTVGWTYAGIETIFEVNIYEGASSSVNTSGIPVFSTEGSLTSPYSVSFAPTNTKYYVASVRVKNTCEYSAYVYSGSLQYIAPFEFLGFGVSTGGTYQIAGSYDGTTWNQTLISGDAFLNASNDGAYDPVNKRWVSVGYLTSPCAFFSNNGGLTWSSTGITGFFTTSGTGIAHDGIGRWVATGYFNPARLLTSTNGLAWSPTTGDEFGVGGSVGRGVAYNSGTWIAVGKTQSGGYPILRSTNGTSWTGVSSASFEGYKVAYGNGVWIAVGQGADTIYRSTDDGLTWSPVSGYGFSTRGQGIAYGNGRWVAVGADTNHNIITSTDDGITWSDVGTPLQYFNANGGYDVLYKNGLWLACGGISSFSDSAIKKSTDGLTWTNCSGDTFIIGAAFGLAST